jgi:hypothetical protein
MKSLFKFRISVVLTLAMTAVSVSAQPKLQWLDGGNKAVELTMPTEVLPIFGTLCNKPIAFFTNSTQKMILTQDGLFGIGVALPKNTLHVHSDVLINSINNAKGVPTQTSNMAYCATQITNATTGKDATDGLKIGVLENTGFITLQELADLTLSTGSGNSLTLYNGGTVGVGTSNADAKLDISTTGTNGLYLQTLNNQYGYGLLSEVAFTKTKALLVKKDQAETFAVLGSGKTGIGTSTPREMLDIMADGASTPLIIAGTTTTVNFKVLNDGWCYAREFHCALTSFYDCVFNEKYALMSLPELESYIKKNQHLPDVPPEKQVLQNGLDLGNFTGILLKQNEEQYLYIIDLNKKVEELQKKVEKLEKLIKE